VGPPYLTKSLVSTRHEEFKINGGGRTKKRKKERAENWLQLHPCRDLRKRIESKEAEAKIDSRERKQPDEEQNRHQTGRKVKK